MSFEPPALVDKLYPFLVLLCSQTYLLSTAAQVAVQRDDSNGEVICFRMAGPTRPVMVGRVACLWAGHVIPRKPVNPQPEACKSSAR